MSEMVERVARAIHEADKARGTPWDKAHAKWKEDTRDVARAAIAAMREPTDTNK